MRTTYSQIEQYWSANVCNGGNKTFPFWFFKGKRILEVGCGSGNDAKEFVKVGTRYTGIDLTSEAVCATKYKVGNRGTVIKMNAEYLDFPDNHFDLVYSFGVLHHTLDISQAVKEIYRVLKPDGRLFLMLYNKFSYRYLVEIMWLRRILWWCHHPKYNKLRKSIPHPTNAEWLSMNTDNLGCPLSRVYTKRSMEKLLREFEVTKTWTTNWGWFRMICGRKERVR